MKVQIIRTDGREEFADIKFSSIPAAIQAEITSTVNLRDGRVMLVDDRGYEVETIKHSENWIELRPVRALKPENAKATALYHSICLPGTKHKIVGDVAIVNDADVDEE